MPTSGDPDRLQQVVWNLLSNAVKFTPSGGRVSIAARRTGDVDEIVVSDTGIGIDAAFLPNVFETFRQADASTTRAHGGLGLGLSIVKQLVALHGGEVSAESEGKDRGATFTVRLPVRSGERRRRRRNRASRSAVSTDGHPRRRRRPDTCECWFGAGGRRPSAAPRRRSADAASRRAEADQRHRHARGGRLCGVRDHGALQQRAHACASRCRVAAPSDAHVPSPQVHVT